MYGARLIKLLCSAAALTLLFAGCTITKDCSTLTEITVDQLLDCVTVDRVVGHLEALQTIADENGGNRAADTNGYDASLLYVANTLKEAGYDIKLDEFDLDYPPPTVLRQTAPDEQTYISGSVIGSSSGTVSGPVYPIELSLDEGPLPDGASAACKMSDFEGLDLSGANDIVLFQEGGCAITQKALNAQQAGAEAAILLVQDFPSIAQGFSIENASELEDGSPSNLTMPIVGAMAEDGPGLAREGSVVFLEAPPRRQVTQYNLLAELPGEEPNQVVMAGAHLDSAPFAPGMNDNGSGSAALLETAVQMAGLKPQNTVRFAWWAAEEYGLVGSAAYLEDLALEELGKIALYLNFDMIGSPNHIFAIYDADDSDHVGNGPCPEGSAAIEKLFESYYSERGIPFDGADPKGGSDYQSFLVKDVALGGLRTGAESIKSKKQAEIFGGTALEPYDACYHTPCDNLDNVNEEVLGINADAVAYAIYHYAMNDLDSLDE